MFLLDTDIISELRRAAHGLSDPGVVAWARATDPTLMRTSVIVLMEIEHGIQRLERKDPAQGRQLRHWFEHQVRPAFGAHALPADLETALICAGLHTRAPRSPHDTLIGATAIRHGLTVVTRNVRDFQAMDVPTLDPFSPEDR
ncbi:MAG: type II toxin-antitoxin system VapC family toxin [Lautropia sp.]|nr:type II toxin-antitoxin system VapC family toxin [Lautropia sp.]